MVTLEQVYELAEQLPLEEKAALVDRLQAALPPPLDYGVTREQLLAEMEELRAVGAFDQVESLYGAFHNPDVDISDEELRAYLREVGREWEAEMDELAPHDDH